MQAVSGVETKEIAQEKRNGLDTGDVNEAKR